MTLFSICQCGSGLRYEECHKAEDDQIRYDLRKLRLIEMTDHTFQVGSRVLAFGTRPGTISDCKVDDGINMYRVDLDGAAECPRAFYYYGDQPVTYGKWLPATCLVEE